MGFLSFKKKKIIIIIHKKIPKKKKNHPFLFLSIFQAEDYQISRNPQWNGINVAPVLNRLPANQSAANSTLPRTNRYPK